MLASAPMRGTALTLLAGLLLSGATHAQSPSADWRTIETKHFRIHFPVAFEPWARHAASAIEGIHERVAQYVGYGPPRLIDVVVKDPAAASNGFAFPFLDRPVIVLWTSPPNAESGIGSYSDWMELVLTHEMAHIVHLTRPRNRPGLFERLSPLPVGPVLWNSPRWLAEGYATVVEGALTGSGRPNSSYRAMILRRFAIEGKLPSYSVLSSTGGWLGGSMAYLVGSTYLEWLEEREGKGSLQKLWKRIASRRRGNFPTAFKGVFGHSPNDLYDRFRAELTARAIEEERRLKAAGLVEGELCQRLEGGTVSPQVSPDGLKLLSRRDPERGESFLAVWPIEEIPEERKGEERRKKQEEELLKDPNEVVDKVEPPRPRAPKWRLPRWNGFEAENPRWMPDRKRILFSRRSPDSDGVLRSDLFLWEFESGRVSRATEFADVSSADPEPKGHWAAGVRGRYGVTELVKVDLATRKTSPILKSPPSDDPWLVWNHPRVSPDGKSIAALLHRGGRWRLVTVPAEGGEAREFALAGSPASPPAWSSDGSHILVSTDASGIWNISSVDAGGGLGPARELTRVTGGAFSPAPTPDGKSLFFLELTGKGINLRRLPLAADPPSPMARPVEGFPILPPPAVEASGLKFSEPPPSRSYHPFETHVLRMVSAFSLGPDGNSYQVGVEGDDVLGRLDWVASVAVGNAAGPRGGSLAAVWSGWPVALNLQIFSALEKPGRQHLVPRSELDQERRGGFAAASWRRPFSGGLVRLETGGGFTRVEPIAGGERFKRSLGSARAQTALRRTRGRSGFGLDLDLVGSFGRTDGSSWNQLLAQARLTGIARPASVSVSARYGDTGGSPTRFDLFALGGAPSSILPPGLDRNRVESPALPAAVQVGEKVEAYRAELTLSSFPLALYAERLRAWNGGSSKPDWIRLEGAELRLERLLPLDLSNSLSLYLGVARIRSSAPRFDSTRGYAGLIYRP